MSRSSSGTPPAEAVDASESADEEATRVDSPSDVITLPQNEPAAEPTAGVPAAAEPETSHPASEGDDRTIDDRSLAEEVYGRESAAEAADIRIDLPPDVITLPQNEPVTEPVAGTLETAEPESSQPASKVADERSNTGKPPAEAAELSESAAEAADVLTDLPSDVVTLPQHEPVAEPAAGILAIAEFESSKPASESGDGQSVLSSVRSDVETPSSIRFIDESVPGTSKSSLEVADVTKPFDESSKESYSSEITFSELSLTELLEEEWSTRGESSGSSPISTHGSYPGRSEEAGRSAAKATTGSRALDEMASDESSSSNAYREPRLSRVTFIKSLSRKPVREWSSRGESSSGSLSTSTHGSYTAASTPDDTSGRSTDGDVPGNLRPERNFLRDVNLQVQIGPRTFVRGHTRASQLTQQRYVFYNNIPFAEPPVGNLRFQPPQPYAERIGIINAPFTENRPCIQTARPRAEDVVGSEDCLYLDIYAPDTPHGLLEKRQLLPVMVFIHGGGFHHGTGSSPTYVPDCFMKHNVIFITFNYRLHIFGFLNLDIPECTGNFGMKDQVMVLKWIQRNIIHFGGDPKNVTIFGTSAGGVSVHLHMISPLSRGLFHKAITQSGTALCPWGIRHNAKFHIYEIARRMGCKSRKERKILRFLKEQDAAQLTKVTHDVAIDAKSEYVCEVYDDSLGPSVECVAEDAFLPLHPLKLRHIVQPVPTIAGITQHEGLMMLRGSTPDLVDFLRDDLSPIFTHNFVCKRKKVGKKKEINQLLRAYYLSNRMLEPEMTEQLNNIFTDLAFFYFHDSFKFWENSSQPIYFYEFRYEGDLNFFKMTEQDEHRKAVHGAAHSDELSFLFHPIAGLENTTERDKRMVHIMSTMWTSFAKYGNPTAELEPEIVWRPSTLSRPCYLKIDENISMEDGRINDERFYFMHWVLSNTTKETSLDDL